MQGNVRSKASDFDVLKSAAQTLQEYLRMDESTPDLYDQIASGDTGAHRFYIEPYNTMFPMQMFTKSKFIPLPPAILANYQGIECASFMGLLPEINRAWITIDQKLYLWDFTHPADFQVYDQFKEVIIAVSLSAPKPGVFTSNVKYVLIVATPVEVTLFAIMWETELSQLRLQQTTYTVPSDNVTMFRVVGSQCGRVFMGGNDGNVYELEYESADSVWSLIGQARKCRKLNRSAWHWKLVHVLPPFLREISGLNDSLVDLVVDDTRHLLYSLSAGGDISLFYLGSDNKSMSTVTSSFNVFEEAHTCVLNRPRESSPKADYLKYNASMKIVGLFVIPPAESSQLHAIVVLATGIRVYLQVLTSDRMAYLKDGFKSAPFALKVPYVRSPPPSEATAACVNKSKVRESSFAPTYLPSQPMNVHTAYYSQGIFMTGVGADNSFDKVVAITEDLVLRSTTSAASSPSMREVLSVISHEASDTKVYDIKDACSLVHHNEAFALRTQFVASKCRNAPPNLAIGVNTSSECVYSGFGPAISVSADSKLNPGLNDTLASSIAPLSELAVQMAPSTRSTKRQVLCLLSNGLIVLSKTRPIDVLYRMVETSAVGDDYLEPGRQFFAAFGLLQSASMCVSIACGVPCDLSNDQPSDPSYLGTDFGVVQRRALSLVQKLGEPCTYKVSSLTSHIQDSRFAVTGTTGFVMSTAHDAIQLFLGRLLRPVWFKKMAVKGKLAGVFGSRKALAAIRVPLLSLRQLLLNYFGSVVKSDLADLRSTDDGSSSLLMKQLQMQTKTQVDQEKLLLREARRKEDCSVHAMFRLVARSIHALSLLDILIAADIEMKVTVDWSKLELAPFCTLVSTVEEHDKMQRLLDSTLEGISANKSAVNISDRLTELLSVHCFLYFSAGDRFRYEASKAIQEAVAASAGNVLVASSSPQPGVADYNSLVGKSTGLVMKACRYWRGLDDVSASSASGTILSSPLQKCCAELELLGAAGRDAIVDLCLATADNFAEPKAIKSMGAEDYVSTADEEWERELYHGGGVFSDDDRMNARRACYRCLIDEIKAVSVSHLKGIGAGVVTALAASSVIHPDNQTKVITRMIERSVAGSKDPIFIEMLYGTLYDWNKELLLRLNLPSIETFLVRKDSLLLYNYLGTHRRANEACDLAAKLALSDGDVDIVDRIKYLVLAVSSLSEVDADGNIVAKSVELQDRLIIAEFQRSIYSALSADLEAIYSFGQVYEGAQKREIDALANLVQSLKFRLKSMSELFLQATEPYKLWDISLQLLFAAKSDDSALIARLWKSVIYRIIPDNSDVFEIGLFLQMKRSPQNIDIDLRKQRSSVPFEEFTSWLPEVVEKVVSLAQAVKAHETDAAFPMGVVVEEMEEVMLQLLLHGRRVERDVVFRALLRIGVSHESVASCYIQLLPRWEARKDEAQIQLVSSCSASLIDWMQRSSGGAAYTSIEFKLLYLAVRNQKVQTWLVKLRHVLNSIPNRGLLPQRFLALMDASVNELSKMEMFANSIVIA